MSSVDVVREPASIVPTPAGLVEVVEGGSRDPSVPAMPGILTKAEVVTQMAAPPRPVGNRRNPVGYSKTD